MKSVFNRKIIISIFGLFGVIVLSCQEDTPPKNKNSIIINESSGSASSIKQIETKIDDKFIWTHSHPNESNFDSQGQLITSSGSEETRTYIGRKFFYSNETKLAVIFFTFSYQDGKKTDYHASTAEVQLAYFYFDHTNGWKLSSLKHWEEIPQPGYGTEPPLELKIFKSKPCLYLKYTDADGGGNEYYYDIENLNELN